MFANKEKYDYNNNYTTVLLYKKTCKYKVISFKKKIQICTLKHKNISIKQQFHGK